MRLQLPFRLIEQLRREPESGMGYQNVEVIVASGDEEGFDTISGVVLNGEWLEIPDEYGITVDEIEDIQIVR